MDKLQELYAKRKIFEDYGAPIPAGLAEEIRTEELDRMENGLHWAIECIDHYFEFGFDGKVTIHLEYTNDIMTCVGVTRDFETEEHSDLYLNNLTHPAFFKLNPEEQAFFDRREGAKNKPAEEECPRVEECYEETSCDADHIRSKSVPFKVKFANGKEIYCSNAQKTFIESLSHMGLEKASQFKGDKFKGYSLIGKEEYVTNDGQPRQKYVDGWWIYTNMPNWRKKRCIEGVAKMLGINLTIEDVRKGGTSLFEPEVPYNPAKTRPKAKITRFSLNGSEPMGKNRSVLESVRRFISQFPDATFEDIAEMFPKHLQGSYGVVRTIDDITVRSTKNKSESDRWFLDPSEILTAADGKRFAVSTEWGHQFPQFQKHLADAFGWLLEEV